MVIRSGERTDSGIYRMTITVGDQVVEHDFDVAVIDYPRTGSRDHVIIIPFRHVVEL